MIQCSTSGYIVKGIESRAMKGHFYCPIHSSIICNSQNVNVKAPQSCLILCDPMDYTVPGILQARILEWVAFPFSRGSSQPKDGTQVCRHCRQILYPLSHQGNQEYQSGQPIPSPADLPDLGIEPGSPALQVDSLPSEL